jgi:opacity protein-like surface antigen
MRRFQLAAICAIAGLLAGPAHAADNGFYIGGSVGQGKTDFDDEILDDFLDGEDTGFKLIAGFRPLDWLGVEVNYVDLGEISQNEDFVDLSDFSLEQKGIAGYGVLFYDFTVFDVFAKAGLVKWEADLSFIGDGQIVEASDDSTDFAWGVGAQARFGSLAARLEYERFQVDVADGFKEPEMISLGVTWTFL